MAVSGSVGGGMMRIGRFTRVALAVGVALGGIGFVTPRSAGASIALDALTADRCGPRKTLVDLQQKICPATPRRPAVVVNRACCANAKGKVHCKAFPHCPRRSPS